MPRMSPRRHLPDSLSSCLLSNRREADLLGTLGGPGVIPSGANPLVPLTMALSTGRRGVARGESNGCWEMKRVGETDERRCVGGHGRVESSARLGSLLGTEESYGNLQHLSSGRAFGAREPGGLASACVAERGLRAGPHRTGPVVCALETAVLDNVLGHVPCLRRRPRRQLRGSCTGEAAAWAGSERECSWGTCAIWPCRGCEALAHSHWPATTDSGARHRSSRSAAF
jgi:hypothetical protein